MTPPQRTARPVPRVTLTVAESAVSLGMSERYFEEHVLPELRVIRMVGGGRGDRRRTFVPVRELERWADRHAGM